jgi:hypothetical protein
MQTAFQASDPQPLEQPRVRRSRHHPRSGRLLVVSSLLLLSWLGLGLFLGYAISLWRTGTSLHGWLALAGLFLFAFGRVLSFILSRHLNCTLCHGPVLHEKRCHKHPDAYRVAPLSYRSSTVVSMLSKGVFRCMYCGTPYRLKK